jgi:hypothetical protein
MLETPADKNSVSKFLFNILNVKVFLEAQGAA